MSLIPNWDVSIWVQVIGVAATIAAAFLGAWLGTSGSESLWQKQVDYQNQNVAKALKIEIVSMQEEVDFNADQFRPDLIPRSFTPRPIPQQFYSDKGLYFAFQKEIAGFSPNLSTHLFIYYNDLITAEYLRNIVNEKSKIISAHPNYQTRAVRTTNDIMEVESSPFVKRFKTNDNAMKMTIWEGYDPNLSEDENVEIAQGRSAEGRLTQLLANASDLQPIILNELDNEIKK
jgi:hypothetical protein